MKKYKHPYLLVSVVGLCYGIMICTIMFKTPVIVKQLAEALNTTSTSATVLFTIYTTVSCILAIPCVFIVKKIGSKKLVMIGSIISIVGSSLGALSFCLSSFQFPIMWFSRCLEGVCYIFASICVPTMIGYSVPKEKKGFCLAIFSAYIPLGSLLGNSLTPQLVTSFGLSATWIIYGVVFAVLSIFMFMIFDSDPSEIEDSKNKEKVKVKNPGSALDIVLFLLSFGMFCLIQIAIINFYPKMLNRTLGLDLPIAGLVGTLPTVIAIVFCIIFGRLSDKHKTFKKVYVFALIFLTVGITLLFRDSMPLMIAGYAICSVGLAAPCVYVVACMELFSEKNVTLGIALSMGVCCLFQSLGNEVCRTVLGSDLSQWSTLALLLGILGAISVVCAIMCKPGGVGRNERKLKQSSK